MDSIELREGLRSIRASMPQGATEARSAEELRSGLVRLRENIRKKREAGAWINSYVNVFQIMGRPRLESAFTYTLAWLLNPQESHRLGDQVLQEMLRHAGGPGLLTAGAEVLPESSFDGGRFDIDVRGRGWRLVIENKIDSREGRLQTDRYADQLGDKGFGIYLTPSGERARNHRFHSLSYGQLRQMLLELKPIGNDDGEDAKMVIRHFCDHLLHEILTRRAR